MVDPAGESPIGNRIKTVFKIFCQEGLLAKLLYGAFDEKIVQTKVHEDGEKVANYYGRAMQ